MIGVFIGTVRIGSLAHFTDNGKHRFWVAYGHECSQQFKTRKAAMAWLVELHTAKETT